MQPLLKFFMFQHQLAQILLLIKAVKSSHAFLKSTLFAVYVPVRFFSMPVSLLAALQLIAFRMIYQIDTETIVHFLPFLVQGVAQSFHRLLCIYLLYSFDVLSQLFRRDSSPGLGIIETWLVMWTGLKPRKLLSYSKQYCWS